MILKNFANQSQENNEASEKLLEESNPTTAAIEKVINNCPGSNDALATTQKTFRNSMKASKDRRIKIKVNQRQIIC